MLSENQQERLKRFGKRLETLRKSQGLSLRKLALKCNIDYADIKRYENGTINLTLVSMMDLADALEMEVKDLLDF
jgi:transcriptional regulator with XRE-family HTH domain